jgi:non-homologous end joining protein Ku
MTVRPTVSDVTVSFGLVSFPVDLLPATKSKQSKAKTASTVPDV